MAKKVMQYADENHKAQLAAFMQSINPKPTLEQIEALKQAYIERRTQKAGEHETNPKREEV